jgi:hypothetical protein
MSRPQGHSAAGNIKSVEKSNDFIRNRTLEIAACSTVPKPLSLPLAPEQCVNKKCVTHALMTQGNIFKCHTVVVLQKTAVQWNLEVPHWILYPQIYIQTDI